MPLGPLGAVPPTLRAPLVPRDHRSEGDDDVRRTTTILVASAVLLVACGDGGATATRGLRPVVVDTDVGQDDMMALLYLAQRPDIRLEAVTVSGTGLAHCGPGVEIVLSLLDLAGVPRDVPVSCGPERPLPGDYPYPGAFPTSWREATDGAYGLELPASDRAPSTTGAPELLSRAIHESGPHVELLTLGPLTNVALALRDDPSLVEDLAGVTIMGGALDVPGNVLRNAVAEFNVWVDPVALREVLASGAEVTLVPLDATNEVPVTPFFADALAGHHVTPEARTVDALFELQPYLLSGQYWFWDPLSAALLAEPGLASYERRTVAVLEGEKETQGQIVDDPSGSPIRVATSPDPLAFEREFLNTLNGDEVVSSTRPAPVATVEVEDDGCAYDGPTELPTGPVAVELVSAASRPWDVVLVSIGGEHTFGDVRRLLSGYERTDRPPGWVGLAAQAGAPPGASTLVSWNVGTGTLALVCVRDEPWEIQAVAEIAAP